MNHDDSSLQDLDDQVPEIIDGLLQWMHDEDLMSYDLFDIKSSRSYMHLDRSNKKYIIKLKNGIIFLEQHFPNVFRLFSKKTKSATSVALYASSCFMLYKVKNDKRLLKLAKYQLNWLEKNSSKGYSGFCWGLPFDWLLPDNILAPKSTPCSTILIYMVDAFLLGYEITGDKKYLRIATSVADFLISDLNKDVASGTAICLSYTPLDTFHIINVNAYAAGILYKIHRYHKRDHLIEFADKLINYVMVEQTMGGGWYYWGSQERRHEGIDSLHQCYIIENLYRCYLVNKNMVIRDAIERALVFFRKNFFVNGAIKKIPISKETRWSYPDELIDHAEAILMFKMLENEFDTHDMLIKTLKYTLKEFKIGNKHYFYSYILRNHKIDIPYIRWGQSQLLYALAFYLVTNRKAIKAEDILL